jgi:hypothetical protein
MNSLTQFSILSRNSLQDTLWVILKELFSRICSSIALNSIENLMSGIPWQAPKEKRKRYRRIFQDANFQSHMPQHSLRKQRMNYHRLSLGLRR